MITMIFVETDDPQGRWRQKFTAVCKLPIQSSHRRGCYGILFLLSFIFLSSNSHFFVSISIIVLSSVTIRDSCHIAITYQSSLI